MNAKHASNTLTLVETPTQTTCPAWCYKHDDEPNVCLGQQVVLDFTGPDRSEYLASAAYVQLSTDPESGTHMTVTVGQGGITLADADRLGDAIKAVVAYARLGGVR